VALSGPFVLDDLTSVVPVKIERLSLAELARVAFSDTSGPFGRSLPVLTFALNYYFGGEDAFSYKVVNLVLHGVNFLIVYFLAVVLLQRMARVQCGLSEREIACLAFCCSAVWALHPMQVSTVMYTVQRMAMLSATFTLCAIFVYIRYRASVRKPLEMFLWLASISVFVLLSCLSKETGVLTILYIALIELLLFPNTTKVVRKYFRRHLLVCTTGLIVVTGLLLSYLMEVLTWYEMREFSLAERLISQANIITDFYLLNIILPNIDDMSLYHDGFIPLGSLDTSFFFSIFIIFSLCLLGVLVRKNHPLLSFAVGFFVISHLLESTVLPLELVFEHRNYLSILSVLLFVFYLLWITVRKLLTNRLPIAVLMVLPIAVSAQQTYVRGLEWSSEVSLVNAALVNKPESVRAKLEVVEMLALDGKLEQLITHLEWSAIHHKDHASFIVNQVTFTGAMGKRNVALLDEAKHRLSTFRVKSADVMALIELKKKRLSGVTNWPEIRYISDLFALAIENEDQAMRQKELAIFHGMHSDLLLEIEDFLQAKVAIKRSIELDPRSVAVNVRLANLLILEGDYAAAKQTLELIDELSSNNKFHYQEIINTLNSRVNEVAEIND